MSNGLALDNTSMVVPVPLSLPVSVPMDMLLTIPVSMHVPVRVSVPVPVPIPVTVPGDFNHSIRILLLKAQKWEQFGQSNPYPSLQLREADGLPRSFDKYNFFFLRNMLTLVRKKTHPCIGISSKGIVQCMV